MNPLNADRTHPLEENAGGKRFDFELEVGPLPTSKGPPSSLVQLRTAVWTGVTRDTMPQAESMHRSKNPHSITAGTREQHGWRYGTTSAILRRAEALHDASNLAGLIARERPDALFVAGDGSSILRVEQIAALAGTASEIPAAFTGIVRICGSRRPDHLRYQPDGGVPSGRRLYRPHPQGRQAGGPAGRAADQVRAGHQSQDRQGAGPRCAGESARPRRRGDRIEMLFAAVHESGCWRAP